MKQADFSIQCQIIRNTVSLIETGKIYPSFDVLYRICIVLDINLSYFTFYVKNSLQKLK
ncbi:helix-turn-helix transcriptional regulator [Clostridium botulinum]|nr:helix-turn-helix transcriptional regulator [Clostridium botulinum]